MLTIVEYVDGTTAKLNIVGTLSNASIPNKSNLKTVRIGTAVTSIGREAFSSCSSLTSVTIPGSVMSIEILAFSGCSSLTSVTIPDSVTSIEKYAFEGCNGLTNMLFKGNKPTIESNTIPSTCTIVVDKHSDWKDSVSIPGTFNGCQIKFSEKTVATYENEDELVDVKQQFVLNPLTTKNSVSIITSLTSHIVIKPSYVGI